MSDSDYNPFRTLLNDDGSKLIAAKNNAKPAQGKRKVSKKASSKKPSKEKRILITGMPGIGNVGRLTTEYLVEMMKPKEIGEIKTRRMPTASFVQESNLIVLPAIKIYQKKSKDYRIFIVSGDYQPLNEEDTFFLCEEIARIAKEAGVELILTTGGIGLPEMVSNPKVYVTGPKEKPLGKLSKAGAKKDIYGIVGPIMGVSGLLPMVSDSVRIDSAVLLAETIASPEAIGLTSAKAMLNVLSKAFDIKINFKKLEDEINELTGTVSKLDKIRSVQSGKNETSYIG